MVHKVKEGGQVNGDNGNRYIYYFGFKQLIVQIIGASRIELSSCIQVNKMICPCVQDRRQPQRDGAAGVHRVVFGAGGK